MKPRVYRVRGHLTMIKESNEKPQASSINKWMIMIDKDKNYRQNEQNQTVVDRWVSIVNINKYIRWRGVIIVPNMSKEVFK